MQASKATPAIAVTPKSLNPSFPVVATIVSLAVLAFVGIATTYGHTSSRPSPSPASIRGVIPSPSVTATSTPTNTPTPVPTASPMPSPTVVPTQAPEFCWWKQLSDGSYVRWCDSKPFVPIFPGLTQPPAAPPTSPTAAGG